MAFTTVVDEFLDIFLDGFHKMSDVVAVFLELLKQKQSLDKVREKSLECLTSLYDCNVTFFGMQWCSKLKLSS